MNFASISVKAELAGIPSSIPYEKLVVRMCISSLSRFFRDHRTRLKHCTDREGLWSSLAFNYLGLAQGVG